MVFTKPKAGPPPAEAIRFFESKGLKPGFSYLDVWRQEHNYSFTVAKVMEADLLGDVKESLTAALENGTTFEDWKAGIKDVFDRSGWSAYGTEEQQPYRLKTIYDTNMRVSRAEGQWERVTKTKAALPNLMYVLGPSEKHREDHVAWAEEPVILPIDDPWWDEHYPPNGYGCKCGVIQISDAKADEFGGVIDSPEVEYTEYKNPVTGETEQIPKGVDPGWNYNPGKERAKQLDEVEQGAVNGE